MSVPFYCAPCGEVLTPEQSECPFCGKNAAPMDEYDRMESQYRKMKSRQTRKDIADVLGVLAVCHSAIRTARIAILRQYDTFSAMNELGVADFKARNILQQYGIDPFAKAEKSA